MQHTANGVSSFNGKYNSDKKLNILFLSPRFPFPLHGGDRIKSYHVLRRLAKHHNVTLVTFHHKTLPTQQQLDAITDLGVELHTIILNPMKAALWSLRTVISRMPLEISFYTLPEYRKIVESLCKERNFDLGISFFMRTAEYLKDKQFPKILIAEDCRYLYQTRSYLAAGSFIQKAVRYWEKFKLEKYEPLITKYFDAVTLVTHEDIAAMKRQNPNSNYKLFTNGVEQDIFESNISVQEKKSILFAGKLDVFANELMAKKNAHVLLPEIRKFIPEATLTIVGKDPSYNVKNLASDVVKIIPNVPAIEKYMLESRMFLHPHNGASGIQNKILQAMACGCPIVTTPTGIQGIDALHERDVLIGNTDEELVNHVVRLYYDTELQHYLAQNAMNVVRNHHSWDSIFQSFQVIINDVIK